MRIAMVSEHASPLATLGGVDAGGQNVHVAALARAVARRGAEVVVHTRRDDPELPEYVQLAEGVVVHHVRAGPAQAVPKDELFPYMGRFGQELKRVWEPRRPDVVHSHFWMSGHAALAAARPLGIPVAHTTHALGIVKRRYQGTKDTSPPERRGVEQDVIDRTDRIVATCTDELFEIVRMGADRERVTVVPSGVDLGKFRPDGPAEPRPADRRRILYVGRLVERKGVGNLVTALASIPDAELVIAGGPDASAVANDPEARRLTSIAEGCGVRDRVDVRGRVDHDRLPELLRSADVVASVPWYEPFGIVPLEAMACGVPVVAAAVGGMIDTVVDDLTGVHVPPRDPERLAEVLRTLLDDPERRRAYGREGVDRAKRLYAWDRVASATLQVYTKLARKRPMVPWRTASGGHSRTRGREHVGALEDALDTVRRRSPAIHDCGERIGELLLEGHRLLAVGNGGSAAQAQHLTAELVGRYQSDRRPLSALCLHGDTSSLTAIANDFGADEAYARQVRAHGRAGDVLVALSTSGRSPNVVAAARAAADAGMWTLALTGAAPNPLADACDEAICLPGPTAATVQELHLIALHLLCAAVDERAALTLREPTAGGRVRRVRELVT
jgi:glycosyltransferase involved in cell wall biosynthesis/phosphoheptose isomerase